jgi:type I site-specific restriction endonuclease
MNEADTRARLIDPKLKQAGWTGSRITREHYYQRGQLVACLDSVADAARQLKRNQDETDAELKRLEQLVLDRGFRGNL